jgi:transposase
VLAWLTRHPRWTFHFTPTSASWLNAVENFFSKMTRQRIRRGVFRSFADLQAAINLISRLHQIRRGYFGQTRPLPCTIGLIKCTSFKIFLVS